MKVIAIANGKGGVGKSTGGAHFAFAAEEAKIKTLAIDFDTQKDFTKYLWGKEGSLDGYKSAADLVYNSGTFNPIRISENLHLMPGANNLEFFDKDQDVDVYFKLRESLIPYDAEYQLGIIDTPGSLDLTNRLASAFVCADYVVVPIELADSSIDALKELTKFIDKVKLRFNPHLRFLGIILNKYDSTRGKEILIRKELENLFGDRILGVIGNRTAINNALTDAIPVWKFKQHGKLDKNACEEIKKTTNKIFTKIFGSDFEVETC